MTQDVAAAARAVRAALDRAALGLVDRHVLVDLVALAAVAGEHLLVLGPPGTAKSQAVRQMIRQAGAKLFFLPKYSPDFQPIEQLFSKLKHGMRQASERTVEAVWRRLGTLLEEFTPQECANYLRNAGYPST